MKSILVLFALIVSSVSFADQCAYTTKEAAETAKALLPVGTEIVGYCEPCIEAREALIAVGRGANRPPIVKRYETVRTSSVVFDGGKYYGIVINGALRDMAYVFVKTQTADGSSFEFRNLSKLAGCPSHDVSEVLPE